MKIRSLAISDYDQIVALWKRSELPFKPSGRDRKGAVQAQIAANPDFFLGAFADNRLAVDPDFRRKRVAEALIKKIREDLAKTWTADLLCVD